MFVAMERFIFDLIKNHGKHQIQQIGIWYPYQACIFLEVDHHINSSYQKCIIESTMQYIMDKIEGLTIIFQVIQKRTVNYDM